MYTTLSEAQRGDIYSSLPDHLQRKVSGVLELPGEGLKTCSACQGNYVTKGAEWIEFWHLTVHTGNDEETIVEYVKPRFMDSLIQRYKDNAGLESLSVSILRDLMQATDVDHFLDEMKGKRTAYLRRFLEKNGDFGGSVLPLLREVCSWECAEGWMKGRMQAEEELAAME